MLTPIERSRKLFYLPRECTCGGVDIGVGIMHEPSCGLPTPEDVADAIQGAILDVIADIIQEIKAEARDCGCSTQILKRILDTRKRHDA